jgi:hypothetical protein
MALRVAMGGLVQSRLHDLCDFLGAQAHVLGSLHLVELTGCRKCGVRLPLELGGLIGIRLGYQLQHGCEASMGVFVK